VLGNTNTLSVTTPGLYNFVSVDALSFCADTASITITQSVNPPALAIANPALLTCTSPTQTLAGSSPVSGVQFSWATISGPDTTLVGTGANLPVSAAGTYFLIGINPANNCANATSVNVLANQTPPVANAGAPLTLDCAGETTNMNGSGTGAPNLNYQWTSQNGNFVSGANTATPLINQSGDYQLLVTNPANGCTDTDAVTITPEVPVAFVSIIQPTCSDLQGTVQVDSVTGLSAPILYSLNNSQPGAQNQFTNLVPGVYTVEVMGGNGCSATEVVTVEVPVLVDITLTTAATVALGDSYQIDATVNLPASDIASITWTPSTGLDCATCLNPLATPLTTTEYELLVVSNVGCEARERLLLTVDKTRKIYVPNIFSPNDDGRNDVFTVFASQVRVEKVKSLQVFSRWGEAIFELRDFEPGDLVTGWDGTFKGEKLNPAVFVWQAVVLFVDGKEEVFTGDVLLQR
jgi:gliding motility-associated-like protein